MNRNKLNPIFAFVKLVNKGDSRSVKAKKNILGLFLLKGSSIAISLILVPMTIHYINPSRYGVWLTLSSIIGWFSYFDVGFGHGLRNKFAEALALGKEQEARTYISTTYAALSIIICALLLVFLFINSFLDWAVILNTPPEMAGELSVLALIVFVFFCLNFIFKLITTVLTANHEPAKASLLPTLANLLSLGIIFMLTKTTSGNLIYLGTVLSLTPVLVLGAASVWFYSTSYKKYAPALRFVKFEYARDLINLGGQFFIINIAVLIMLQTDNIIITQVLGPDQVTVFNVTYKLFGVITMIYGIIATPLWSAYTDAYAKKDIAWINKTLWVTRKIWIVLIVFTGLILFCSPPIFRLWLGDSVDVPFSLSMAMSLYVIAYVWQTIHTFLLNGIGKIRLQLYLVSFLGLIHIPMAIFLGKQFGLVGITLLGAGIFAFTGSVFAVQINKILNNRAARIWNQ